MTFLELAEKILQEERQPLSAVEIWSIAQQKGYDATIGSKGKTPERTIGARIYVDIRDNPNSRFYKAASRPTKFFLKDVTAHPRISATEPTKLQSAYSERDLHKVLCYFLYTYKSIYSKTIYHEKSIKRQFSQWLHPDMVGVYFAIEKWLPEVSDIAKEIGNVGLRLYSFEIKKALDYTNLRESFFQAVSNSSWAHEGFLVAADILMEDDFQQELKRLTNSFGIGIIKLDVENPDSSEILIPAQEKEMIDVETINKMSEVNKSFRDFLKGIKIDLTSKEIRKERYDKVLPVEELRMNTDE